MIRALAATGFVAAIGVAVFATLPNVPAPPPRAPERVAAQAPQPRPLSAQAARVLLASGAVLADVREPNELAATGKLEGALNVPLTSSSNSPPTARFRPSSKAPSSGR